MELLSLVLLLFIPVFTVSANTDRNSYEYKNNCRKCKAGYYAIRKCNDRHDTVCAPCPKGSYTTSKNWAASCSICSSCGPGLFKLKPCSTTHDVFCESCSISAHSHTKSYKKFCLGNKHDLMFADEALLLNEKDKLNIHLHDEGSGDKETDIIIDHKIISTLDNSTSIKNDTEDSGSGDIAIVIEPETEFLTPNPEPVSENKTTENVTKNKETEVILPDKIQATPSTTVKPSTASSSPSALVTTRLTSFTTSPTTTISTKATSSVSTSLKTTALTTTTSTKETTTSTTATTTKPSTTTTTTAKPSTTTTTKTGVIEEEESGILLGSENKNHSLNGEIIYIADEIATIKPGKGENGVKSSVNPAVAAQKEEMSGDTDSVTIGVVVAIAIIAAIIFFVLGFLVSRYCKRRRRSSFQVMKRVEGNGAAHNGGIPVDIEYRVPETTGIYDEIGKEPNGNYDNSNNTVIVPERADNIYAVIDKSKKRPASPKMAEELNKIRYIDETTDDEVENREIDKLLESELNEPPEPPRQNGSLQHSKELETVNEESESTPMLNDEETNDSNEEKQDTDNGNPVV